MTFASAVWESTASWAGVARVLLVPASAIYRGVTAARNALYDRGALSIARPPIPVISVGNIAVGGTGKTPVAAWMAAELMSRGAAPAIVLRGYGDDEPRVHQLLNPGIPVIVNADRVTGVNDAMARGADVAVLDDAFQHRRIARIEDVVLVSADRWREPVRLLPAGPWRETPRALSRASLVLVTRKAVASDRAVALMRRLAPMTGTGRGAVAALAVDGFRNAVTESVLGLSDIRGTRVLAAAGIADPWSLAEQLRGAGAHVEMRVFPDHHVYSSSDIEDLVRSSGAFDHTVCTLKDAVKLGLQWPREGPPLWYVSQRCTIEHGSTLVSEMLERVLAARPTQLR